MRKAIILGKVVITSVKQPIGAPIVDECGGRTREGVSWRGYALHLSPWQKNTYGDRVEGLALCIGLVKGKP